MAPEPSERLVSTGTFKVDRPRALEKLMRFALPDPAGGILLLARCATASGAKTFSVDRGPGSALTVRFDGLPFPRAELESPYDALFKKAGGNARGRELGVALLSLLRLEPAYILVRSGPTGQRTMLRLSRSEPETVESISDTSQETTVRFSPGPGTPASLWGPALEEALKRSLPMCPFEVLLEGKALPLSPLPRDAESADVRGAGLRGSVWVPARRLETSRLRLHRLGVLVGEVEVSLEGPPVEGRIESPAFRLNVSQTAVVRDERFRAALTAAADAARRLAVSSAGRQSERVGQLALILDNAPLRRVWTRTVEDWLTPPRPGLMGALGRILAVPDEGADRELAALVRADARRALWLREAASGRALSKEAAEAVRQSPVYVGPDLKSFSTEALMRTVSMLGGLPVSDTLSAVTPPYAVVWSSGAAETESFERLFPGISTMPARGALAMEDALAKAGGRKPAALARVGFVDLAARRPLLPPLSGEIGLPVRRPDAARIHVFIGGEAAQHFAVRTPLRFAAAVAASAPLTPEQARRAAEVVLEQAGELYAGAAADWSPGDAGTAGEARRAHLLDALAWRMAPGSPDKPPSWLTSLPLFRCEQGLLTARDLRSRLAGGDTLFFCAEHSRAFLPGLTFTHPSFTQDFLAAVLPGAAVRAVPGRDLFAVWDPRVPAPDGDSAAIGRLEASLREAGTYWEAPDDPRRAEVLSAVAALFAPWSTGAKPLPRWHKAREHLSCLPMFRRPRGGSWTLPELDARLASSEPLAYAAEPGPAVEILLNAAETGLLDALWPAAHLLAAPAAGAAPAEPAGASAVPLAFDSPMLAARELSDAGLRALIALPPEPMPGVTVRLLSLREPRDAELSMPGAAAAGRMLVDISHWEGPVFDGKKLHEGLARPLRAMWHRYLTGLLDDWPDASAGPAGSALRVYALMLAVPKKGAAGAWASVRQRIDALPLFPTLGGGATTLADLRLAVRDGRLLCARAPMPPPDPRAVGVPVVVNRALVEAALDARLEDWAPEAPSPGADQGILSRVEALLARIRGRKGLDPALAPPRGKVTVADEGEAPLVSPDGRGWRINAAHPAARAALDPSLPPDLQAAFLLSAAATAINRAQASATDADDALFQALLAEAAGGGDA